MPHSTLYLVAGALSGLLPPAGLLLHQALRGPSDERTIFAWLAAGGVLLLAAAGWMIGRREDALVARNRRLTAMSEELRLAAMTDPLTEISNRRAFDQRLAVEIAMAVRYGTPLALVMLDLDLFKRINDQLGHPAGDAILRRIGAILSRERRSGDLVARYGGEEMVALLPQTCERDAMAWAERVRQIIASASPIVPVTASFGVADLAGCAERTGPALVAAADRALLLAKQTGRNRVVACQAPSAIRAARPADRGIRSPPAWAGQAKVRDDRDLIRRVIRPVAGVARALSPGTALAKVRQHDR
jgi:diguanylate cyclase (GGDEF)-like protein